MDKSLGDNKMKECVLWSSSAETGPTIRRTGMFCMIALMLVTSLVTSVTAQNFVKETDINNPLVTDEGARRYVGVCWVDFDSDGLLDLFLPNTNGSFLYKNWGDSFAVVPGNAFLSDPATYVGATWGDYDNDGDPDCFVAGLASGALYRNDGGGNFTKLTESELGTGNLAGWSPAWADFDNDSYLDLVITFPAGFMAVPNRSNRLLHNDGPPNFTFTQLDTGVVVTGQDPYTSANWSDYDDDGDVDLFIGSGPATTHTAPDNLYMNMLMENGAPGFERISTSPIATDQADGQIWSWNDYDNDGDLDAYRTNWGGGNPDASVRKNDLYRNDGGTFVAVTGQQISDDEDISLASVWGDFDNDGDLDCVVANDAGGVSKYYRNNGDGTFTWQILGDLGTEGSHAGASAGDYDNDGDLDLFCNSNGSNRSFYINILFGSNGWLKLKLNGVKSNRSAIGAKVHAKATIDGSPVWLRREIAAQNTFLGHNSETVHFGLGDASVVDSIVIEWPSGEVNYLTDVAPNQTLTVEEQCPDNDGDGLSCFDNCPDVANVDQVDTDGDGIGDACDACPNDPDNDIDGDGICGDVDACPLDPDNDADSDGLCADVDNCPNVANADQTDTDGDGIGDLCDACAADSLNDADGDGFCADVDNCPSLQNADQSDVDGDGVGDLCDNCPDVANPGQEDSDGNGTGDACEGCCAGIAGNVDADPNEIVDIGDLTRLIDFLYISTTELTCPEEGNVDGDPDGLVDIGDLTALIDYLYISTAPPAACQ
jgi:hypothetical protein